MAGLGAAPGKHGRRVPGLWAALHGKALRSASNSWLPGTVSSPPGSQCRSSRAITQRPERQFTSGLVCTKALFLVFHGHRFACELSLWSLVFGECAFPPVSLGPAGWLLSYSQSTGARARGHWQPGDSFSHELAAQDTSNRTHINRFS